MESFLGLKKKLADMLKSTLMECFKTGWSPTAIDADCVKIVLSKLIGYGIIAGAAFVKVPQILKLKNAKSAEGLNWVGILMELYGVTISAAYSYSRGFPFSSWGEALFLMLTTFIISFLVFKYNREEKKSYFFVAIYSMFTYLLFADVLPASVLWYGQATIIPVAITGKLIQAYQNYQQGHTGQLSAITITLLTAGTILRIFTTIQETGDSLFLATFLIAAAANLLLAFQVFYYWNATADLDKKKMKSRKAKKTE